MVEISQNFVAFSEYMNFMTYRPCPIMSYFGWPHPTQKLDIIYGRVLVVFMKYINNEQQ